MFTNNKAIEGRKPTRAQVVARARGIRNVDIARKTGMNESTICRILNGLRAPDKEQARQIAECLGVSAGWAFDRIRESGNRREAV